MTQDQAVRRIVEDVEYLKDLAADLRSVTWLLSVSASEMNARDRWLADELDKTADRLLAVLSAPPAEPLYRKCPDCTGGYVVTEDDEYNCNTCETVGFVPVKAAASPTPGTRQEDR